MENSEEIRTKIVFLSATDEEIIQTRKNIEDVLSKIASRIAGEKLKVTLA